MFGPLLIICALLVFAAGVLWIRGNVAKDEDSLITTIDTLLPQTQCAQCGYPGCRPYAQAVAEGAQIDLCPPGGQELVVQLSELMGVEIPAQKLAEPLALVAVIDEAECIGCTLCLPPCPVDCHHWRPRVYAHRAQQRLHRLRTVHRTLPSRLHYLRTGRQRKRKCDRQALRTERQRMY